VNLPEFLRDLLPRSHNEIATASCGPITDDRCLNVNAVSFRGKNRLAYALPVVLKTINATFRYVSSLIV